MNVRFDGIDVVDKFVGLVGADDFAAVGFVIDEFVEEFTILWDYSLANLLDNEQFICIKGYFYV